MAAVRRRRGSARRGCGEKGEGGQAGARPRAAPYPSPWQRAPLTWARLPPPLALGPRRKRRSAQARPCPPLASHPAPPRPHSGPRPMPPAVPGPRRKARRRRCPRCFIGKVQSGSRDAVPSEPPPGRRPRPSPGPAPALGPGAAPPPRPLAALGACSSPCPASVHRGGLEELHQVLVLGVDEVRGLLPSVGGSLQAGPQGDEVPAGDRELSRPGPPGAHCPDPRLQGALRPRRSRVHLRYGAPS